MKLVLARFLAIYLLMVQTSINAKVGKDIEWIKTEGIPVGGIQFVMLADKNHLYTLGGLASKADYNSSSPSDKVFSCNKKSLCNPRSSMLIPRHSFTAGIVDGKIYVIGGLSINNSAIEVVDVYDPAKDLWWRKSSSLPTPRYGLASVSYKGKLYAVGGALIDGNGNVKSTSVLEVYEPNKDEWFKKKAEMPTPRHGFSLVELNGKIYAIGGWVSGYESFNPKETALSSVEVYDPIRDTWQKKQNMPTPRGWLTTYVVNQKIYAVGGKSSNDVQLNNIESYDPVSDTWKKEKSLPIGIHGLTSVVWDNEVIVAGGVTCTINCLSDHSYKLSLPEPTSEIYDSKYIDTFFKEKWTQNNITPAIKSDNYEFQRRVTLDILGRVPTPQEIKSFNKHNNRNALIEQLLNDKSFYKYWSEVFSSQIYGSGVGNFGHEKNATASFIAHELEKNSSYKKIVSEIVTADPSPHLGANQKNPGVFVGYYAAQHRNPKRVEDLVNNVGRAFMGSQLHCAQCHDSHVDKRTTQADYYGLVAFFSGFRIVDGKLVDTSKIEFTPERYSKPLSPRFINGELPKENETNRAAFARLLTDSEEFALSFVNNVWSNFFGLPLANPSNSMSTIPETEIHPLLKNLSLQVKKDNFDLKRLIRFITNSEVYQLTSRNQKSQNAGKYYSVHPVRPMNPEQMFNSISVATGLEKAYLNEKLPDEVNFMIRYSQDFGFIKQYFIEVMNKTADYESPNSHYEYTANISQVLKSLDTNSVFYAGTKLKNDGRLKEIVKRNNSINGVVTELYLNTLSRPPTKREMEESKNFLLAQNNLNDGYESFFCALLNTNEFFFNH